MDVFLMSAIRGAMHSDSGSSQTAERRTYHGNRLFTKDTVDISRRARELVDHIL
jgi:hypothetical protein